MNAEEKGGNEVSSALVFYPEHVVRPSFQSRNPARARGEDESALDSGRSNSVTTLLWSDSVFLTLLSLYFYVLLISLFFSVISNLKTFLNDRLRLNTTLNWNFRLFTIRSIREYANSVKFQRLKQSYSRVVLIVLSKFPPGALKIFMKFVICELIKFQCT